MSPGYVAYLRHAIPFFYYFYKRLAPNGAVGRIIDMPFLINPGLTVTIHGKTPLGVKYR